jgi:hypothetical protein
MANNRLTKSYAAGGVIGANLIVKFSADYTVVVAGAATDLLIGVTTEIDAASGERVDVIHGGIADVKAGGTIARGALVTADAAGKAVAAAPAQGVNNHVLGRALIAAADGDIIPVLLAPGIMQGA